MLQFDDGNLLTRTPALSFVEHCILVASRSAQTNDGIFINRALAAVAEAWWPDLAAGAMTTFDDDEIVVRTSKAVYYISVRGVRR